jgi:hypothetical protein
MKPEPAVPGDVVRPPVPNAPIDRDAPDFAVIDDVGLISTLDHFKGRVLLVGIVSSDAKEAIGNLQSLYDEFGAEPAVRILAVAERNSKVHGTFPIVFNQGSRLLGLGDGQFALISPEGKTQFQGSLSDAAALARLRTQLGAAFHR